MKHASLFSNIGGFDLAAEKCGFENVFHCEINPFGQKVLSHYWPNAESFGDIKNSNFKKYAGKIDMLTGGFPCQDNSNANQSVSRRSGLNGIRSGLAYDMLRAISEIKPAFIVAENVPGIFKTNGGKDFGFILDSLASMGYNAEWRVCFASEIGAPHRRSRMYLVAYSNSIRLQEGQTFFSDVSQTITPIPWVFNGTSIPLVRAGSWESEPPTICMDDGFSGKIFGLSSSQFRKEQIKAYGNAVVPEIPFRIFKAIEKYKNNFLKR